MRLNDPKGIAVDPCTGDVFIVDPLPDFSSSILDTKMQAQRAGRTADEEEKEGKANDSKSKGDVSAEEEEEGDTRRSTARVKVAYQRRRKQAR